MVQRIGLFLPATYFVYGLQRAMLAGAKLQNLGMVLVSLVAWAALAAFISSQLFRWEPEAKLPRNAKLWPWPRFFLSSFWASGKITTASSSRPRPT